MKKVNLYFARFLALLALVAAIIAVLVIVHEAKKTDDDDGKGRNTPAKQKQAEKPTKKPRTKAKTYTVQPGDTLTQISRETGVPLFEIEKLNPEIDALSLISGETLKLR